MLINWPRLSHHIPTVFNYFSSFFPFNLFSFPSFFFVCFIFGFPFSFLVNFICARKFALRQCYLLAVDEEKKKKVKQKNKKKTLFHHGLVIYCNPYSMLMFFQVDVKLPLMSCFKNCRCFIAYIIVFFLSNGNRTRFPNFSLPGCTRQVKYTKRIKLLELGTNGVLSECKCSQIKNDNFSLSRVSFKKGRIQEY